MPNCRIYKCVATSLFPGKRISVLSFCFCLLGGGGLEVGLHARDIKWGSSEQNVSTSDDASQAFIACANHHWWCWCIRNIKQFPLYWEVIKCTGWGVGSWLRYLFPWYWRHHVERVIRQIQILQSGENQLLSPVAIGRFSLFEFDSIVTSCGTGDATEEVVVTSRANAPNNCMGLTTSVFFVSGWALISRRTLCLKDIWGLGKRIQIFDSEICDKNWKSAWAAEILMNRL